MRTPSRAAIDKRRSKMSRNRRILGALAAIVASVGAISILGPSIFRQPQHVSILSGKLYLKELLSGHPDSFYDVIGLSQCTFWKLLFELVHFGGLQGARSPGGISASEKLATFLNQSRTCVSIRPLKNRWQHSSETISRYFAIFIYIYQISHELYYRNFHEVLDALVSSGFYNRHVRPPPDEVPAEIKNNPKLYPYFEDVRATTDGSLFPGHFSARDHARYRCRKGECCHIAM